MPTYKLPSLMICVLPLLYRKQSACKGKRPGHRALVLTALPQLMLKGVEIQLPFRFYMVFKCFHHDFISMFSKVFLELIYDLS